MRFFSLILLFLLGCEFQNDPFKLSEESYSIWRKYIKPNKKDLLWKSIPWKSSFKEGMIEANIMKKPLLLWVMNGHPLGCT